MTLDSARRPFARADFERAPRLLLRDGRWANARVWRAEIAGLPWVVKDFAPRTLWVRNTIGRVLIGRELSALARLAGIDGVPADSFRIDAHSMAARYIEGQTLGKIPAADQTPGFFEAFERLMMSVHARGIVHLDVRGSGNMLMRPDGMPALIDFQAALNVGWMPASWRRWFGDIDLAGVYKKWAVRDAASMGPQRQAVLEHMNRWRRWWLLRGYAGARKKPAKDAARP